MIESNVYFTCGRPRSGKSTFARKWQKEMPMRVVISSDSIRLALHGKRYNFLSETMVFAIKHIMIRAFLNQGYKILIDGTNSSKISIQRILEIDPNAVCILFDTNEETCIERAIDSNQSDLIPAIKRIGKNIEEIEKVGLQEFMARILDEIKERQEC